MSGGQADETLQRVGPEKTEAEIFNEMLERYPCFLGAAHLKLILTLHNLYGVFDGDFETYATFATLKKVAESGIITHSTEDIAGHPIEDAYSQYLLSQEVPFYDFYPSVPGHWHQLLQTLTHPLHQMPCSEDVLVEFLNAQSFFITTDIKHQLAVLVAKTGYPNALKVLLDPPYSVSPNYECPQEGENLLLLVARTGNSETMKALIAGGANVNFANQYGNTALMLAAENGQTEIMQALIAAGADMHHVNQFGRTALMLAAACGNTEIVQALIDARVNVNHTNRYGDTALDCALATQNGKTALIWAAYYGYLDMVQTLIDAGADIDRHSIAAADERGHTEIVKLLKDKQSTRFIRCAKYAFMDGYREKLEKLIDHGVHINCTDEFGYTALMYAAQRRDTDLVKMLIAAGADVHHVDENGTSALTLATEYGHTEIVQLLKDAQRAQILPQNRSSIFSTPQSHEDRDSKNAKPS